MAVGDGWQRYLLIDVDGRREWLIPGFHAVIDSGISGAHDDPQNFDLGTWAAALKGILDELQ